MSKFRMSNQDVLKKFVLPQMIAMLFNSVYLIVDGVFIGHRLGPEALAAAGLAVPVVEIVIALAMMISVGAGVKISQAFAKDDVTKANHLFNQANVLTIILSLGLSIFGFIYVKELSQWLGASPEVIHDTTTYLKYFFMGLPFLMFSFTLSTFVRNDQSPKRAMWALVVGAISNIILDYVFMYPLNLGMAGAALATALGPVFGVMILLPHFLKKEGSLVFKYVKMTKAFIKDLIHSGSPAFITNFSIGMTALFYNLAIVRFDYGDLGLSAYLIVGYISLIALRCFMGAAQGIQPILTIYKEQEQEDRIESLNLFMSFVISLFALGVLMIILLFKEPLTRIFTSDERLIMTSLPIIKVYFFNLVFASLNILIATNLQALNHQRASLLLSLSRTTLPLIFFLMSLQYLIPNGGIWWAMSATELFTLGLSIYYWNKYQPKVLKIKS